jgi:hypothetical protein
MSSETRTFNFTNRIRIAREHISIQVDDAKAGGSPVFRTRLALDGYEFAASDLVYLEAYRNTEWQRYELGTIGALKVTASIAMTEFASVEGVRFRLKVVSAEKTTSGDKLIRGQAENIRPELSGATESLLPLIPDQSLVTELWRLQLDDHTGPTVHVSVSLVPDRYAFARSSEFLTLAMPVIVRRILEWAVSEPDFDWAGQWHVHPRALWLRSSMELLGQEEIPGFLGEPSDQQDDERDAWVDDAVAAFCRQVELEKLSRIWLKCD